MASAMMIERVCRPRQHQEHALPIWFILFSYVVVGALFIACKMSETVVDVLVACSVFALIGVVAIYLVYLDVHKPIAITG